MSQDTLLAEVVSILGGVSGVGAVHDYERYSRSYSEWIELMSDSNIVNGWTVSRESTQAERETVATIKNRHLFRIKGYYKLDDPNASEQTFQNLLDSIRAAFFNKKTLNGAAMNSDPVTVDLVALKEIAPDYFVLITELGLQSEEREWI